MNTLFATGLTVVFALGMTTAVDADTITVTRKVVKVTHEQCVLTRMGRARTEAAKQNANRWCIRHGDTITTHM
jgi:hypothetical protein